MEEVGRTGLARMGGWMPAGLARMEVGCPRGGWWHGVMPVRRLVQNSVLFWFKTAQNIQKTFLIVILGPVFVFYIKRLIRNQL